ncbi:MAG: ATP-dependent Clp protease ATP-binding subunit [Candidatus Magasanikbacteria bacterium]|nr:ATP-dependent Clp protease ATP-binding subunit [Candidatus Magasanikbacteria bacterium]
MLFEKQLPLNLLPCNTCWGSGYEGVRKCKECKGMSMGRFARGKFLYWGEPLTKYHINVRKARRWLERFEALGALIFGLGFLLLFAWLVYRDNLVTAIFTRDFWFVRTQNFASLPFLFWLSVISFSFLIYRLIVTNRRPAMVEWHDYHDKKEQMELEKGDLIQTWARVSKLSRRKRVDVSASFTEEARAVLEEAYRLALKYEQSEISSIHLFYALLSSSKIAGLFIRLGVSVQTLQAFLSKLFVKGAEKRIPVVSADAQQILFQAYEKAYSDRQEFVHVTELLIATVRQSEPIQELLYDLKVDKDKLGNVVEWLRVRERLRGQYKKFSRAAARRSKYGLDRAMTAIATPYLNSFSQDLTMAAKFGYLAPCVARDKEIEEIFRIVEGGRQSVALVGERGVGKMSIIEGIAQKMVEEDVPKRLQDKRLVQLSTSALLAGTTVSGAQERLIRIMNEIARAKNIILFIKNIQDLVSINVGEGSEGMDVSETLAEYLGSGRFLTLTTSTVEGYNRHILNSEIGSALARVDIKEMDKNQTIQVLESKVGSVEYKHNVFFSYDALAQSVDMAKKFLHDQVLPESAIAIMSEAASFARNKKGENQLVSAEDVSAIVADKTGIPVASISEDESVKLLRLEEEMHKRVVGQDEAVNLVANALRRARAEIRTQTKPIANFLFLGPTGVGKTELAKTIADVYFGGENRMIRVDMSEYQEKGSIYRLIGQPGQQGTGILTEAVRQHPFSLVLLDEMEKAEPDVLNLFLQVFDDGRLTDSVGKVIDFTNTIIIATSNAGTSFVQEQMTKGEQLENIRQALIRGELKKYYRPEFLNRFDGIILFRALERDEIKQIAGLMLKRVGKDLEKRGVGLKVEEPALEALAKVGFDPEFGARPMRRAIQEYVENKLAELILANKLKRRDVVVIGDDLEMRIEV